MTISTKPEDIDSPETILHYMDSYPASGQNRAAAKLIRELLAAAPLVADTTPISNSQLKTMASLLGAAISDAENSGLRNVCIRLKSELLNMIEQPVATTDNAEAESHKRMFMQAIASLSDIDEALGINEDGCGGPEETIFAIEELKQQLADVLAGQVAPQATEGAPFGWLVTFNGCNPQFVTDRTFVEDIAEGGVEIEADIALFDHPTSKADTGEAFDFTAHLARQAAWSEKTFGPGHRVEMVIDHIRKELLEIEAAPQDLEEWVDLIQLALDGAWRSGASPSQIFAGIIAKQTKNEGRTWPDWRTADHTKAIEHDRSKDAAPVEATNDEVIDLAEQLVWVTVENAIDNTAAGASLLNEGEVRTGMELACEEIKARLGFDAATPTTVKAEQAPDKHPSALSIAGIARKHFGSPIPPAAYAFASELIAATLSTIKAEPTGEQL